MQNIARISYIVALQLALAAALSPLGVSAIEEVRGRHTGEARDLSYSVEYLEPAGVTVVHEGGITFKPYGSSSYTEPTLLPQNYFGSYPLYFSGETLGFRISLTNTGKRTFENLEVLAYQEWLDVGGGWGELFPEPNEVRWQVEKLSPGETAVLYGEAAIPVMGESGLDQTHLQVLHGTRDPEPSGRSGGGEIILDDAQAGVWCPVVL